MAFWRKIRIALTYQRCFRSTELLLEFWWIFWIWSNGFFMAHFNHSQNYIFPLFYKLCHSHLCTDQQIYIIALSKLRESAEISAVQYTKLHNIFHLAIEKVEIVFLSRFFYVYPRSLFWKIWKNTYLPYWKRAEFVKLGMK